MTCDEVLSQIRAESREQTARERYEETHGEDCAELAAEWRGESPPDTLECDQCGEVVSSSCDAAAECVLTLDSDDDRFLTGHHYCSAACAERAEPGAKTITWEEHRR